MTTKISWTQCTVNPFPGCRKVSPGCQNCYAEKMARRLKAMGLPAYQDVVDEKGWTCKVGCQSEILRRIRNPQAKQFYGCHKMFFIQSMGDVFYEGITDDRRRDIFWTIQRSGRHIFQVLTKRPENALRFMSGAPTLANLWLGVTAENQEWANQRIPVLLQIPAAVRFVSLEPLLAPIDLNHVSWKLSECSAVCGTVLGSDGTQFSPGGARGVGLDWLVVGPETGPGRRPCKLAWIESIVEQCQTAGVPCHVKAIPLPDGRIEHNIRKFPKHLQVREFPTQRRSNEET
jgi:protein gp37